MGQSRFRLPQSWLFAGLMLMASTGPAWANYYELLRRVPDSANTIILIDVERMLMSPIAMKEKWRDKANASQRQSRSTSRSTRSATCSRRSSTSSSNFENLWDVALIEAISRLSLPYLAKTEGGYLDKVEGLAGRVLAPQRLLRVVQAHDPGCLLPCQPAGPGPLAAVRPEARRAAGFGVSSEVRSRWPMARITSSSRSTLETCSRAARCATGCITPRASRARMSISTRSPRCSLR